VARYYAQGVSFAMVWLRYFTRHCRDSSDIAIKISQIGVARLLLCIILLCMHPLRREENVAGFDSQLRKPINISEQVENETD
jgi:hypothetical protein